MLWIIYCASLVRSNLELLFRFRLVGFCWNGAGGVVAGGGGKVGFRGLVG